MIVTKATIGTVCQKYDTEKKRFVGQEFIASDDVTWEKENGDSIGMDEQSKLGLGNTDTVEPYLNFEMKSPAEIAGINNFKKGDFVLVTPVEGDLAQHEFQGHVKGFRCGELVTVEDQEGNCFDCYPDQLESLEEKDRTSD
jgi:hypothetical protein